MSISGDGSGGGDAVKNNDDSIHRGNLNQRSFISRHLRREKLYESKSPALVYAAPDTHEVSSSQQPQ